MDVDVDKRVAQGSKAFGALRKAVFLDGNLSLSTKRRLYNACVLSVLLHEAECWTPLRKHLSSPTSLGALCASIADLYCFSYFNCSLMESIVNFKMTTGLISPNDTP